MPVAIVVSHGASTCDGHFAPPSHFKLLQRGLHRCSSSNPLWPISSSRAVRTNSFAIAYGSNNVGGLLGWDIASGRKCRKNTTIFWKIQDALKTTSSRQINFANFAPFRSATSSSIRFFSKVLDGPSSSPSRPTETFLSSKVPPKSRTWILVARTIKAIRIPFLVLTVFGVGYNQGKIDYARDPKGEEELLLVTVLAGVGATPSKRLTSPLDPRIHQVQRVGKRITKVAASHVNQQLEKCIVNCSNKIEQSDLEVTEERMTKLLQTDRESIKWALAERHVSGSWEYYLVESPIPNAFVSEILPNKIFVTTSMIDQFIHNDDEMALILGHELSHLILGHVSKSNTLETFLRAFEVLLLSVDPTEGAASLVMMFAYWIMRKLIGAAHSQENEREADELGIKLAAMACYDTKIASEVFEKIHRYEQTGGTPVDQDGAVVEGRERRAASIDWFDSHPPVKERYEYLVAESDVENKDKYINDECYTVKGRLLKMLQRVKAKPNQEEQPSLSAQ